MIRVDYNDLSEGMRLATAVYDDRSGAELLSAGTELTLRHIKLLRNLGIEEVEIEEVQENAIPVDKYKKEIEQVQKEAGKKEPYIFEPAARNIVNKNMEINILTGEGAIPIDVKHAETLRERKALFSDIKATGVLDLQQMKKNLVKTLPDVVRNNDVLKRLNELQRTDDYLFEHSMRVSILSTMIGKWFGYSQSEMLELNEAGMLYDIGNLSLPDSIFKKEGKLTKDEWEQVRTHPRQGYGILLKTEGVSPEVKYAALHHHERLDGSGYPLRLRENQIHHFAKIIMVCDVFDALTTDRPYKKKISPMLALDYLMWNAAKLFDPQVVYMLTKGLSTFFVGKQCILSTGERAKIVHMDQNAPTHPIVQTADRFVNLNDDRSIAIEDIL